MHESIFSLPAIPDVSLQHLIFYPTKHLSSTTKARNSSIPVAGVTFAAYFPIPTVLTLVLIRFGSPSTKLNPGVGPRHLIFHPTENLAFVTEELKSSVSSYRVNADDGALKPIQTLSTLPEDFEGTNHVADLRLTPDGRHLYVSNRGHNSVVTYSVNVKEGTMTPEGWEKTGDCPRSIKVTPDGKILVVANQYSNDLLTFAIDEKIGKLNPTGNSLNIPNPVSIDFAAI